MRKLIYSCFILGVILCFTSCSDKQYQSLFEKQNALTDSVSQKTVAAVNSYQIKPQDILQIKNLQNIKYIVDEAPSSSAGGGTGSQGQEYQVEEDGTVGLPVIGHVPVAGYTRAGAQKMIEDLYKKNLLTNPIIELKIVNLKVTILGEIKSQGNYPLVKDRTTLVELIGEAGGLTDKANEKNIRIIRGTSANPQVTMVDLSKIQSINDPSTMLQSGDIIYIGQNKRAARNDNLQSFSVIAQPALLLLNTALIIFTLARR